MNPTQYKDALTVTYEQLEEIRKKILPLLHRTGLDKRDVHTIATLIRGTYEDLFLIEEKAKNVTITEDLTF